MTRQLQRLAALEARVRGATVTTDNAQTDDGAFIHKRLRLEAVSWEQLLLELKELERKRHKLELQSMMPVSTSGVQSSF